MMVHKNKLRKKDIVKVPFNSPHIGKEELLNIDKAHQLNQLSGDGYFTKKCNAWLEKKLNAKKVLLTHSCTAALEMMSLLTNIGPGDEVIMPSFTFVSTANAFVLRGAIPVFVDIRPDTLNIDENLIEKAITCKTKAIMVVHYAGISCEMDKIKKIAEQYNLYFFEDVAQSLFSTYKSIQTGTIGDLGSFSFHETKNIISGEGGALVVNNPDLIERAEIIREKGTNRSKYLRGQIDKYTWVDVGSSYLPGELIAAFLYAQLAKSSKIINKRLEIWTRYNETLGELEQLGHIRSPIVPLHVKHNGHLFYLLTKELSIRQSLIGYLKKNGINAAFHYVPLHSSPGGLKYGRTAGKLSVTEEYSDRLIRLPLFYDMRLSQVDEVVSAIKRFYRS